jgi:hypothetical protein
MLKTLMAFPGWLLGRIRLFVFHIKRARALRKAKREDQNIYPLW